MSELEMLLQQKREIENKIRQLKVTNYFQYGNVRLMKKDTDDHAWQIAFLAKQRHCRYESKLEAESNGRTWENRARVIDEEVDRWQMVYRHNTKEEAVSRIDQMIYELTALKRIITGEGENK